MKTHSSRRKGGFTLVELLVVIAIIAVLAAAGFAGVTAAMQKARKVTTQATCMAIEQAVNSFYTEYGTMPKDDMDEDETVKTDKGSADGVTLLEVLLGKEEADEPLNLKAIKYLTVKEGKADKNGIIYDNTGDRVTGLYDPWGGPFHVMLDGNNDEKVAPAPFGTTEITLNRRVAVWSEGADYNDAKKPADDVKSW